VLKLRFSGAMLATSYARGPQAVPIGVEIVARTRPSVAYKSGFYRPCIQSKLQRRCVEGGMAAKRWTQMKRARRAGLIGAV
jgi:hypothetical protein